MMSLASQMYDYYVKPYLGEKGQDLVEYALLLAIVVAWIPEIRNVPFDHS